MRHKNEERMSKKIIRSGLAISAAVGGTMLAADTAAFAEETVVEDETTLGCSDTVVLTAACETQQVKPEGGSCQGSTSESTSERPSCSETPV